jgi:hypothetical protein
MSNTNVTTMTPEMKTIQKNKKKSITFTRVQEVKIDFDDWLDGLEEEIDAIAAEKLWSTMVEDTCGEVNVDDYNEDTDWMTEHLEEATDDAKEEIHRESIREKYKLCPHHIQAKACEFCSPEKTRDERMVSYEAWGGVERRDAIAKEMRLL